MLSPLYTAIIEWVAAFNEDVTNVATPPLNVPVAIETPPSLNVTVPDGVPTAPVVVAVKVTVSPYIDGLSDEPSVIVTFALFTT